MNSVINMIKCPRCDREAVSEYYYNTGEEDVSCVQCGHKYEGRYMRDENLKPITKDGSSDYRVENLIWIENTVNPYACFHGKVFDSILTEVGGLDSEAEIESFKADVEQRKKEIERAFISRFNEEKKEIEVEELVDCIK